MLPMVQRFTAQRPGKSPGAPAAARPGTEEAEETSQAWPKKLKGRLGWKNPRPTWASCHKPTMTGEIWVLFWGLPHWYQAIHVYISKQKGTPWSAVFHCTLQPLTLHMCHGFVTALQTIDNFCLFFSAMAKQKQNPKKTRNQKHKKKKKKQQHDKTQLSATTPPIGVCNLVSLF